MRGDPGDDALLAGMGTGDADAAETFVRRHAPAVIGVAAAIVVDRHQAEDIAQETFWRVWRGASTYDARRGSVRSWMLAIARNAAIDHVRVRRARPMAPATLAALLVEEDRGDAPDGRLMAGAEAQAVRRALDGVPHDQRRALLMATVEGRTAAEIGDIEGIPLGTAKTRIRSGLRRVRDALALESRRG